MIQKEQSSILTQEVPKIKLPNQGLVGVTKSEPKKEIPKEAAQLPQPTGWRILVLPFKIKMIDFEVHKWHIYMRYDMQA